MAETVRAALIGCGMISDTHAAAMKANNIQISGVYDANAASAARFAQRHGIAVYPTLEALLADDTALVAICTPSGTHADLAVAVLEAGKNAVVEKPVALTVADCGRILEAERRTGKLCAPICQLRCSEVFRQLKEQIDAGAFGKLILGSLSMKYYRSPEYYAGSWRGTKRMDGGGALMNQGIHGVDMLCGLLGYPESVSGNAATLLHDIEVEDIASASLVFPGGTLGVLDGSTAITHSRPRRLELCGTAASVTVLEDRLAEVEGIPLEPKKEMSLNSSSDPAAIDTALHSAQYTEILAAIRGEKPLGYTAREASKTVAVILGIYESAQTGRAVRFDDIAFW